MKSIQLLKKANSLALQNTSPFRTKKLKNDLNEILAEMEQEKAARSATFKEGLLTGAIFGFLAGMIFAGVLVNLAGV
jgi:hypothetical protein|tara:strand:+ start:897 stop:1127 length:231 start_codon:yes stop_codon:yes gene_type:complete